MAAEPIPQPRARTRSVLRVVLWAAVVVALTACVLPLTSRPVTWDELLYMGLAYEPAPDPRILNRYTHIYLLSAFMWVSRDPYLAARVFWSLSLVVGVMALVAGASRWQGPLRAFVFSTFALLLAGQTTIVETFGLPYSDYTVMLITCLSVALLLPRLFDGREIPFGTALLLGLLFGFGVRSKEVIIALASLAGVFFFSPEGRFRIGARPIGLLAAWIFAAAAALATTIALDGLILGDFGFYLSGENWRTLIRFNDIAGKGFTSPYSWLSWLFRSENFTSFLLYLATLVPFVALERNPRVTVVALVPLAYLAVFLANYFNGNSVVVWRYAVVFQPVMCLLAALAAGRLLERAARSPTARDVALGAGSVFALLALAAVPVGLHLKWSEWLTVPFLHELVLPGIVVGGAALVSLALGALPRLTLPVGVLLFGALCATGVVPALVAAKLLIEGELRKKGQERFADLNAITDVIELRPEAHVMVERGVYDRELWDRGPQFLRFLLFMNERRRIPPDNVLYLESVLNLPPLEVQYYEIILATPAGAAELVRRFEAFEPSQRPEYVLIHGPRGKMSAVWVRKPNDSMPASMPAGYPASFPARGPAPASSTAGPSASAPAAISSSPGR